jgi:hypothetical protein
MDVAANDALPIEGHELNFWAVLPGGQQICLGFIDANGRTHRIVLPFDALTGLLMTLPRMLQSALDERFPDGSLRVVHPLGPWLLEAAAGDNGLILKLGTPDAFEVAFSVRDEDAGPLGAALLGSPNGVNSNLMRKPH